MVAATVRSLEDEEQEAQDGCCYCSYSKREYTSTTTNLYQNHHHLLPCFLDNINQITHAVGIDTGTCNGWEYKEEYYFYHNNRSYDINNSSDNIGIDTGTYNGGGGDIAISVGISNIV